MGRPSTPPIQFTKAEILHLRLVLHASRPNCWMPHTLRGALLTEKLMERFDAALGLLPISGDAPRG